MLLAVIFTGALMRAILMPLPGNSGDVAALIRFADQVLDGGPQSLYDPEDLRQVEGSFTYPPLFPMLLAVSLYLERAIRQAVLDTGGEGFAASAGALDSLVVKAWAVAGDALLAWCAWQEVRRVRGRRRATVVVAAILWSPALAYGGAYWGQIDAMLAACVVAASTAMLDRRWWSVGAWMAIGALLKPQMVVAAPIIGLGTIIIGGRRGVVHSGVAALATGAAITSPFWLTGRLGLLGDTYLHAVGAIPAVTVNADNGWTALCSLPLTLTCGSDQELLGWGLTYSHAGLVALSACAFVVSVSLLPAFRSLGKQPTANALPAGRERGDRATVLLGMSILYIGFFMLPTQVHERYLLPGVAILAISIVNYSDSIILYAIFSLTLLANLVAVVGISEYSQVVIYTAGFTPLRVSLINSILFFNCIALLVSLIGAPARMPPYRTSRAFRMRWALPGAVCAGAISFCSAVSAWSWPDATYVFTDWLILTGAGSIVVRIGMGALRRMNLLHL